MSEKKEIISLNQSNSEKELINQYSNNPDNKTPSIIENTPENFSSYTYKNGNKLVLSGINLQVLQNQELLNKLIISHITAIEVDLSNCNLNFFPEILFKLKHLSILDLRNNEFQNFEELVQKLSLFTNLTDLKIDLVDQNQVLLILSTIPRLIFLNGKSTKEAITIVDVDEKDIEDISLQNDLQVYNEIVNKINMKDKDEKFVSDFQNKLYEEAEKVKNCLNNNVPNYIYANVVIQSQFELQKILSKKFLDFLDENNKNIGEILFQSIFKSGERLVELMNNLYPRIEEKTDGLRTQLEEAWKSAEDIGDFENKFNEMKKLKDIIAGENEIIKIKMNKLEKENKVMMDKLFFFGNNIANKIKISSNQIISKSSSNNNLGNESKRLVNVESKIFLENDINNKNIGNNENTKPDKIENEKNIENNYPDLSKNKTDINLITPKILSIKTAKDIMQEIYNSKSIYDQKCYENKTPRETLEQYMYTYLNQKYGLKNLIIEWASSIINAIKMYSNEDCDINLFGKILRNEQEEDSRLVLENLKNNISELLEYYLSSKNPFKSKADIKKMLKNKKEGILLEEEWKGIVNYIYTEEDAEIIQNKIINFIKKKNDKSIIPLSLYAQTGVGPTEIFNLTSGTLGSNNNNNLLPNLSTFNYNSNFSNNLNGSNSMNYLLSYHGTNKKLSREDIYNITKLEDMMNITYKDFLRLLCIYQIKNRDKYLKNFVNLFRKHDSDLDGILTETEFANLIRDIPYCKSNEDEYIFKFLSIIDPFNNKKITFSECVSILSMEMIEQNPEDYNKENNNEANTNEVNTEKKEDNNYNAKSKRNIKNQISLLDKICL